MELTSIDVVLIDYIFDSSFSSFIRLGFQTSYQDPKYTTCLATYHLPSF
jgi:hypothetical protein